MNANQQEHENKMYGKKPMVDSKWLKAVSMPNVGVNRRATLFSGGDIHCDAQRYAECFTFWVNDIANEVILTINEWTLNEPGNVPYFEVDWLDDCIPTMDQLESYTKCLCALLAECFPSQLFRLVIAMNMPQIVMEKDKKKYKLGFHVVANGLLVTSKINLVIAAILNVRITTICPIWANKTDCASYKPENSSLRPIYSHKMIPCPSCVKASREQRSKSADEEKPKTSRTKRKMEDCLNSDCHNGKVLHWNFYQVGWIMEHPRMVLEPHTCDVGTALRLMSIVARPRQFQSEFTTPHDCPKTPEEIKDLTCTRALPKGFRLTNKLSAGRYALHYDFCNKMLQKFVREYIPSNRLATPISGIIVNGFSLTENQDGHFVKLKQASSRASILILVVGVKYCFYIHKEHKGNNVYFVLQKTGKLVFHCHDPVCMAQASTHAISLSLDEIDQREFHQLFFVQSEPTIKREVVLPQAKMKTGDELEKLKMEMACQTPIKRLSKLKTK